MLFLFLLGLLTRCEVNILFVKQIKTLAAPPIQIKLYDIFYVYRIDRSGNSVNACSFSYVFQRIVCFNCAYTLLIIYILMF